jgi:carboxymethylenebutenolidase
MKTPMEATLDIADSTALEATQNEPPLGRGGSDIEFSAGRKSVAGYLSVPAAGHGHGVLVAHEEWGLVGHTRDVCDRLAREGFLALAPDLYDGRIASDPTHAAEMAGELQPNRVGGVLEGAIAALVNENRCDGRALGALGFGMGGTLALFAAARSPRIGAVVVFYGALPGWSIDVSRLEAAVLGIFAEHDELVSAKQRRSLEISLEARGRGHRFRVQPGARRGYMSDARPDRYDPAAAAAGWDATLAFLRTELP